MIWYCPSCQKQPEHQVTEARCPDCGTLLRGEARCLLCRQSVELRPTRDAWGNRELPVLPYASRFCTRCTVLIISALGAALLSALAAVGKSVS